MERTGKNRKIASRGIFVTPEMKGLIRLLRHSANLSIDALSAKAFVGEKTLKKIENPKSTQKSFDERVLIDIAKVLGVTFDELVSGHQNKQGESIINFGFLSEQFSAIDHILLPLIRDHRYAKKNLIEQAYWGLLSQHLHQKNIMLDDIARLMHNPVHQKAFLCGLPEPGLILDISEDLSKITYRCRQGKKLTVKSPQLLWDCHCDTPIAKPNTFKCPIHSHPLGKTIDHHFSASFVQIRYGELKFYWRNSQELWPPSIDSFYMLEAMKKDGLFIKKHRSILDIGSGTGFLGITAAYNNPYITEVALSDWLLTPHLYGNINWLLNKKNKEHIVCKTNIGLFTGGVDSAEKSYDVVMCNPPYLPLLDGFSELGLESTVAGTDLLTHVILKSKSLGNKVYVQFSNLALPEALLAEKDAGVKLKPIGDEKMVPFRMRILWEKKEYLNTLVKERGLIEKKNDRHRFWHRLQTYVIE